jgi:hypothetical protein
MSKLNAISFLDEDMSFDAKNKIAYKNFITITTYTLCMSVSLGVNELFLCFLEEKSLNKVYKTFLYVMVLLLFTIIFSYFLNLNIDL